MPEKMRMRCSAAPRRAVGEPGPVPTGVALVDVGARRDDLVDAVEHVRAQLALERRQLALELLDRARADDRGGDGGVVGDERERHLYQRHTGLLRKLAQRLRGLEL